MVVFSRAVLSQDRLFSFILQSLRPRLRHLVHGHSDDDDCADDDELDVHRDAEQRAVAPARG
jgi:hypothetical protein